MIAVCACRMVVPALLRHELRHHDRHHLVGLPPRGELADVADERLDQQPVGRVQDHEPDSGSPVAPLLLDGGGGFGVGRHVDGRHVLGQRAGVVQPGDGPAVDAAHGE
jgi:hypothetical protein